MAPYEKSHLLGMGSHRSFHYGVSQMMVQNGDESHGIPIRENIQKTDPIQVVSNLVIACL